MSDGRGLPLLSGPPPEYSANEPACRKCNKEFNVFFTRSRRCNHCGYSYCHSCTDFQALMPRRGSESGYDAVPVCGYCIEYLQITACGKGQLKLHPMAKLKRYAKAYNIDVSGVLEKDEFIDRLISARTASGSLPPANEAYYRKHSVPNRANARPRGLFTRAMDAMGAASSAAPSSVPPPPPRQQQQGQYGQRAPYQPRQRTTSGPSRYTRAGPQQQQQQQYHQQQQRYQQSRHAPPSGPPPPPHGTRPSPSPGAAHNLNVPSPAPGPARPRSASATHPSSSSSSPAPAHAPVDAPSIDTLLTLPDDALGRLSVGALKEVLFKNHVLAGPVVEKRELVERVRTLVEDERRERERRAREEEEEERELEEELRRVRREEEAAAAAAARRRPAEQENAVHEGGGGDEGEGGDAGEGVDAGASAGAGGASSPPQASATPQTPPHAPPSPQVAAGSTLTPKAQAMASRLERTGLCVICQDEEANIAIVDCGHLAMCRGCSDLIMKSTRECPLCRTRIVTESRLLRIFKT